MGMRGTRGGMSRQGNTKSTMHNAGRIASRVFVQYLRSLRSV